MKRCPTCQQTYTDETQSFCMNDGTPLVSETPSSYNLEKTMASASPPNYGGAPPGNWSPPPPPWQSQVTQVAAPARKRNLLPWILGGAALMIVGLVAAGVIAFMTLRGSSDKQGRILDTGIGSNTSEKSSDTSSTANANRNSNQAVTQSNTNSGTSNDDEETVLAQLLEVERQWTEANLSADKAALDRILADEYKGTAENGQVFNKAQEIARVAPDPDVKSWSIDGAKLSSLSGDTAVLNGFLTLRYRNGASDRYRFIDTFVKRDGRWQATASKASLVK
ncbi:MAG TPA: nuclear transport factor 2 family protein [Pyrinomonadaceae bacterium]|nr:nuclear transport factor 2 family protein [Pyrinomonadaceae bacterium]